MFFIGPVTKRIGGPGGAPGGIVFAIGFCQGRIMKFALQVGETEKHLVEFSYQQLVGSLLIKVDKQPIRRSVRLINEPLHEVFQFAVGHAVKTDVRIEKRRKQLLGYRNSVYVDGRLVHVFE
jgi:hypothetical protein